MKIRKILVSIIIFIVTLPLFVWLESGFSIKSPIDLIKPLCFSFSATFSYMNFYRKFLLISSLFLLTIMVFFYLIWKIDLSNWFGSLGFGMLIIYVAGYFPQLLKKGYIEKL